MSGFNPIPSSPQTKTPSIFTPKGKAEYQEQVKAFKPQEVSKEGQPKPAKKVDGGMATAFMKGINDFNSGLFKTPRLLYDAASSITDTALQALNITETDSNYNDILASSGYQSPLSILDRIGDYYTGQANEYEARQEKFSKGIIDSFEAGEYKNGGKQLLNNIAGSVPSMVGMALTGGAGNIGKLGYVQKTFVNALPFVSQKNAELSEDESIPKSVRVVNSTLNGLSEVIFDQSFGTQAMIQKIGQAFVNEGKEQAVKIAKDFTKGFATEAIKKIQPVTGTIKGAVEEMSTQLSQNIVDKYTVNPDKDLMEGVLDAGLVGGVMTGGIGALGTVALSSSQKKKAGDLMKQREELVDDLDNDNLPEEVKDNLSYKLQSIDNDLSKIDDDGEVVSFNLSEKDKAIVSEKEQNISSIEQALQDESISETSKEILADTLIKEQDAIDEILTKPQTDAIQIETAGQVPVLTEATVGEEVEQGKPQAEPQGIAQEGVQEEVVGQFIIEPTERISWSKYGKEYKVGDVIDGNQLDELSGDLVGNAPNERFVLVQEPLSKFDDNRESLLSQEKGYEQEEIDRLELMKANFDQTPPIPQEGDGMHRIVVAKELGNKTILMWKNIKDVTPAQEVKRLRAAEQAELNAAIPNADQYKTDGKVDRNKITDAKDLKKFDKIYNKYDNLITPLLPKTEEKITNEQKAKTKASEDIRPEPTTRSDTAKQAKVKPIRQLGTGANVYFEADKYRVNDSDKGGVLLNIQNQTDVVPIANINFDNASDAVQIAERVNRDYPNGVPDALLVEKYIDGLKKELLLPTKEAKVEFSNPQEATRYAIENSNDPDEVASLYFQEETPEPDYKVQGIMEYMGGKGKINERDWKRYNDINNLSPEIRKRFIDKDNKQMPLDASAQELSNMLGVPVSEEDFIDAIIDFNSQKDFAEAKKSPNQREAERKYKELTGKNLTAKRAEDAFFRVMNKPLTDKEIYEYNTALQEIGITYEDIERYNEYSQQESDGVKETNRTKDNDARTGRQVRGESESVQEPRAEPKLKAKEKTQELFAKAIELFNDISATKGGAKKRTLSNKRKLFLEQNPSIKYIDDNWKRISKQLEDKGLLKKEGNCP